MKDRKIQKVSKVKKPNDISRREAMVKMGYTAFSAATMLLLLNKPEKAQATDSSFSADDPDTW